MGGKPLRIRFDKREGVIKIYNGIRYLEFLNLYSAINDWINSRIYNVIFDRINDLISEKSNITDGTDHNFARIRIDSYNSLPV